MLRLAGIAGAIGAVALVAYAQPAPPDAAKVEAGKKAFVQVAKVLQSPRCMNCHPVGDRPLQTDQSKPHAQNISRLSIASGLACTTCHQDRNSESLGIAGGPPGAPKWGLPPAETPMVFQGRTVAALCAQIKDPEQNGHRTLAQLLDHVAHDPLVGWGWNPGGKRTLPPLTRAQTVAAMTTWVDSGGACPE
jgi:hypothetical protein